MRYKILKYPTKFGLVLDNTKFEFCDNNVIGYKKDGKCFVNGVEYNLGNPCYICYPLGFTQSQKKSVSRHQKEEKIERREKRRKRKGERMKRNFEEHRRYRPCDIGCGGQMTWCSFCEMYSNDCCVDYGTCQCS